MYVRVLFSVRPLLSLPPLHPLHLPSATYAFEHMTLMFDQRNTGGNQNHFDSV